MRWSIFLWQRESWRAFWRQRTIVVPLLAAAVLVVVCWVSVSMAPKPLDNALVLRYSIYLGINWLTDPFWIWIVPVASTVTVALNVVLAYTIGRSGLVLKYVWLWMSVALAGGWLWLLWLLARFNS